MVEKIDPELAPDPDTDEEDVEEIELPDYDPAAFELPLDYEYVDEEDDDDGSEDEAQGAT